MVTMTSRNSGRSSPADAKGSKDETTKREQDNRLTPRSYAKLECRQGEAQPLKKGGGERRWEASNGNGRQGYGMHKHVEVGRYGTRHGGDPHPSTPEIRKIH